MYEVKCMMKCVHQKHNASVARFLFYIFPEKSRRDHICRHRLIQWWVTENRLCITIECLMFDIIVHE